MPFLNLILVAVLLLFIVFWLNAFIILYHFIRFGIGPRPKQAALIFFGGSFVLFIFLTFALSATLFFPQ